MHNIFHGLQTKQKSKPRYQKKAEQPKSVSVTLVDFRSRIQKPTVSSERKQFDAKTK